MNRQCQATTKASTPCKTIPALGNPYCPAHDPARDEERCRLGSKGGKLSGKPHAELENIKTILYRIAEKRSTASTGRRLSTEKTLDLERKEDDERGNAEEQQVQARAERGEGACSGAGGGPRHLGCPLLHQGVQGRAAERVQETVQGAYEKFTESVDDARSQTARAKERSQDMAADLQEYTSGGLDVSASMNREYRQAAVHRFENGTRLEDMTPEQVGAAGVPS